MGIDAKDATSWILGRTDDIECGSGQRVDARASGVRRKLWLSLLLAFFVTGWPWLVCRELVAAQPDRGGPAAKNSTPAADVRQQPAVKPADSDEYRIRVGDTLSIAVFQEAELSLEAKVPQSGSIRYPLLGVIQVKGCSLSELEKKITELLAKDYLVNPRVSITVEANKSRRVVTILGEVKQPGTIEMPDQEQFTLLQLVGRAGGFTNIAATDHITIIRMENGKEQTIRVNVAAIIKSGDRNKDIELKAGDVVSVPQSFF